MGRKANRVIDLLEWAGWVLIVIGVVLWVVLLVGWLVGVWGLTSVETSTESPSRAMRIPVLRAAK